jgi:ubiquinone/menaquinone biosynthesis C-methylase UbiE
VTAKARERNPDGYVHSRDIAEYQRLRDQAERWRRATEELLDRIGLESGMSCLDVGAGPGAVMRLMAGRVGPRAASPASRSTAGSAPKHWAIFAAKGAPYSN